MVIMRPVYTMTLLPHTWMLNVSRGLVSRVVGLLGFGFAIAPVRAVSVEALSQGVDAAKGRQLAGGDG